MVFVANWHLTSLIQYFIHAYFLRLSTVLVVHNSSDVDQIHFEYRDAIMQALCISRRNDEDDDDNKAKPDADRKPMRRGIHMVALQWIDVAHLDDSGFEAQMLTNVDSAAIEGFITILSNTSRFLHARYYASRYSTLRLKDKFYLFLCDEHESPQDLLTSELLQFYPHHLMVTPKRKQINDYQSPAIVENQSLKRETENQPKPVTVAASKTYFWPTKAAVKLPTKRQVTGTTTTAMSKQTPTKGLQSLLSSLSSSSASSASSSSPLSLSSHQSSKLTLPQQLNSTNLSGIAVESTTPSKEATQLKRILLTTSEGKSSPPLLPLRDINFELWTQKYIGAIGNLDPVLLNEFFPNETFLYRNIELYPNKLLNMQGRALYLGSITYIPYTITNYVPAGTGNVDPINPNDPNRTVSFIGTEAEIMITFCQRRNCHLRVRPYGGDNWGIVLANGTATGMLGDIYLQRVEAAIGCIYNWYNDVTETSITIARSSVTLLSPAPELFPAWRTNILPFRSEVWALTLTTLLICVCVLYSIKIIPHNFNYQNISILHHELVQQTCLEIYAVFLQQTYAFSISKHLAIRVFLAILFGAALTLENAYSGQLKSILAVPFYSDAVDTTEKFSKTDWKWAAPSIVWVDTISKSDLHKEQRLTKKFEVRDYDFLFNVSFRKDYGLAIERLNSGTFSLGKYITLPSLDTKIIPKDDIYFDFTRAVAIRGWPIMPLLDEHIRLYMETGLFFHLERQMVEKQLDRRILESVRNLASGHKQKSPPQKLSVASISGAIFALLMGHLLASIVFLTEVFAHNILSWWNQAFPFKFKLKV